MSVISIPHSSGIYIILNIKSRKVYIGQAQDLRYRWRKHKERLKRGNHPNPHLQSAWNKYGAKTFKFQVLEYCPIDKLDEREQHFLDIYIPKGICYNIASDAVSPMRGRIMSAETRRRVSEAHKGNKYCLGKKPSEETRRKLSEAMKRRPPPEPISEETRYRLSESHKRKSPSPETRAKLSAINKGKKLTPEHRAKIGSSNSGKIASIEARRKMSESAKRRVAKQFILTDPNGIEYSIMGLCRWCRENGFDQSRMSKIIKNGGTYKGWKCRRLE
jgi:group I intron endonuclease